MRHHQSTRGIKRPKSTHTTTVDKMHASQLENLQVSRDLHVNEQFLREAFQDASDVVFHHFHLQDQRKALLIYIDGLTDEKALDEFVCKPLLDQNTHHSMKKSSRTLQDVFMAQLIPSAQTSYAPELTKVIDGIVKASVAILIDGESRAWLVSLKSWAERTVEEPSAEAVIRGPREGFTENFRVNTSLVRRKIRNPNLKIVQLSVGRTTRTEVGLIYIAGIVDMSVLEEVKKRMQHIDIDGVLESCYIEEFIEDAPFSPFPQIQNTERPDVVAASLLEGKVAILVDGSPFCLIVPFTFWTGIQAAEDYYIRSMYATFIRWIRLLLLGTALLLPSIYVAITTFHPQMIPTNLLLSFATAREPSPFPAVVEALIMEVTFEGLREAGIRLPKMIGSAISIVGALVIGQAAVQAGLVSAPIVIVVSATGIASFAIPRYNFGMAIRFLRFPMLILAGSFGFYGITMGLLTLLTHLVNLKSFGTPYLAPIAPRKQASLDDTLLRVPWWRLRRHPFFIRNRSIRSRGRV